MRPLVVYLEAMNLPKSLICIYGRQNRNISYIATISYLVEQRDLVGAVTVEHSFESLCCGFLEVLGQKLGLFKIIYNSIHIQNDFTNL